MAGWLELPDQLGFALRGVVGQFKPECGGSVAPDFGVGRVATVPMAQQAFPDVALPDEKNFAFFIQEAVDALGVGSLEFNPGLAPCVLVAFDSYHGRPRNKG
jgi:hypothetical protein